LAAAGRDLCDRGGVVGGGTEPVGAAAGAGVDLDALVLAAVSAGAAFFFGTGCAGGGGDPDAARRGDLSGVGIVACHLDPVFRSAGAAVSRAGPSLVGGAGAGS